MKKKILALATAIAITSSGALIGGTQAQAESPSVLVPSDVYISAEGKIIEGRTYVPIRPVASTVGAGVKWNQKEQSVTLTRGGIEVVIKVDSPVAVINGMELELEVPIKQIGGTTYIQARAVTGLLGGKIKWDAKTGITTVTYEGNTLSVSTK